MKRVFLSHSSKDKWFYIENVVSKLTRLIGSDKFIYDSKTFEEGQETSQEIKKWLENTDLFVLFISDAALKSDWVKKEILKAKDLLDKKELHKIYPIIIDESITHEDPRIPKWMSDTYNIRYISQSTVAARKIHNRLIELIWEKNPKVKDKNNFFVGRNELIDSIEERIDSYNKDFPTTLIATGLKDIGRRSLLKRSLIKTSVIQDSYFMPTVTLDAHQSVEDFILLLNDLGFEYKLEENETLMTLSRDDKVQIAVKMLKEMKSVKDILLIIDEGAIVSPTREISEWFINLNNELNKENNGMTLCVISKHRTRFQDLDKAPTIFSIHVPELSTNERYRLFTRYIRLLDLNLNEDDIRFAVNFFSGLPMEILYTAEFIEQNDIGSLKRDTTVITDFSDRRVSRMINNYEGNNKAYSLLALIATFDFISYALLEEIIKNDSDYSVLIEDFLTIGICENLGIDGEYICLNSAIKNYVRRQQFEIEKDLRIALKIHVEEFMKNIESVSERDVSDVFFSLREAISLNRDVDNRMLIPSHYLKSMKELYDRRDRDQDVVNLADRILVNEEFMDDHIAREIRYFLCSSLARLKEDRFKEEVQKIKGPEHNFLFGFYYRHVGRDSDAINSLLKALSERQKFGRAKRELVLVYNNNEEYDKALNLAQENYESNKNNEYHIQAYFQCLSYGKVEILSFEERKVKAAQLLNDISKIDSDKAKSMALVMDIQFNLYFKDDLNEAKKLITDQAFKYPTDIFVLLTSFDVFEKLGDIENLKKTLETIKLLHVNPKSKYHRDYLKCLAIYKAIEGDIIKARQIVRDMNTSEVAKRSLRNKIEKYEHVSK
ncbi:TIR domain-containing protein [Chryseomicrobium aureum]|uniref:TIR domain-containing protein n=1 Tax=Chryseomicrobium aureum TaxID=1441723 RepID=UPI00370D6640